MKSQDFQTAHVVVELKNVTKTYPGIIAVDDMSLSLASGEVMGLLGPNGAGKSTTMKMIAGLLSPDAGQVMIQGREWQPWDRHRPRIGLLLEEPPLYPELSVKAYLELVAGISELSQKKVKNAIDRVVERMRLQSVYKRLIRTLSKGYRQRLGLAQALLPNPPLLLLDEPTNGLDPHSIREMRDLILGLKGEHTIIISSHQLHEIEILCQSLAIIDGGRVKFNGPIQKARALFGQSQKVRLTLTHWNPHWEKAIPKHLKITRLAASLESPQEMELDLQATSAEINNDVRREVLNWAQATDLPLLEMAKVPIPLEELFMAVTGAQQ